MSESEYDDIPLEEQNKLYYITISINGIVVVFLLFFLYVLFRIKQKFTFQNFIILQIIITRFIHSSYALFPIINTKELESSWMCTAQTIVINLSLFCLTLHVLTILIISYYSLVRPESLLLLLTGLLVLVYHQSFYSQRIELIQLETVEEIY